MIFLPAEADAGAVPAYMDGWVFTFNANRRKITFAKQLRKLKMPLKTKLRGPFVRVVANLIIGVVGLVIVRLIAQNLPMFKDAGWIVADKMTVLAGALIVIDALLLSVLVRFAIELRAYLLGRFTEIPGLGTMAATLVFLIATAIAYIDFKPLTTTWPAIAQFYLWGFFALAAILLIQIVVLLYRDRDSISARVLGQPMPAPSDQPANLGAATSAAAGR